MPNNKPRLLSRLNPLRNVERVDLRNAALLVVIAILIYWPGIDWGLPQANAPGTTRPWAPDELGPIGPIVELRSWLGGNLGNPQYPMFHYLVIFIFYVPYLAFQLLTGGLVSPQGGFPFGFTDPSSSVKHLLLIARGVSVLMAAGMVIIAYVLSKRLWNRTTGLLAAVAFMLLYPMFYYGKMSRVDVPSLFWTGLVLLSFERFLRDGLTVRRGVAMGVFAALAIATKDQAYAVLLVIGLTVAALHLWHGELREKSRAAGRWKPLLMAAGASIAVYLLASGLAIRPQKFLQHVEFIRKGNVAGRFYFEYANSLAGYAGLLRESLQHLRDTMNTPLLICALLGVWVCARSQRRALWLLLPVPGLFLLAFVPVRYVEMRYVIFWGFILTCFAARGLTWCWENASRTVRFAMLALFLAGCGLSLAKGVDLVRIMRGDSRYAAATWLAQNTRADDRIEFFGEPRRVTLMPQLAQAREWLPSEIKRTTANGEAQPRAEWVVLLGPDDLQNHWNCPEWAYRRFLDGGFGYALAAEFKTASLFEPVHDRNLSINPRILIFGRTGRVAPAHAGQQGK